MVHPQTSTRGAPGASISFLSKHKVRSMSGQAKKSKLPEGVLDSIEKQQTKEQRLVDVTL